MPARKILLLVFGVVGIFSAILWILSGFLGASARASFADALFAIGTCFLLAGLGAFFFSGFWKDERIRELERFRRGEAFKSECVSFVAHQLRSPMTQMRWIVESLLEKPVTKDVREGLDELYAAVITENRLVSDLLNISRIERGVLRLNLENAPVGALIEVAVSPLVRAAKDRGVHVRLPRRFRNARVRVDAEKAVEALRNVLDNAIAYTTRKTPVEIGIERGPEEFVVTVRDHGTGIPEESREHLFEMKVSEDGVSPSGGAGIGMYLARRFLQEMGGSIDFKTSALGTTFFLHLPKARKSG
jgi:signal transduction histidine kinase